MIFSFGKMKNLSLDGTLTAFVDPSLGGREKVVDSTSYAGPATVPFDKRSDQRLLKNLMGKIGSPLASISSLG